MGTVIFDNGVHKCIIYDDILGGRGDIQSNQFLIIHNNEGLLYDIGGMKVMLPLYKEISKIIPPRNIKTIILSHQDPDTGAGVNYWMQFTNIKIRTFVSSLWVRFIPHLCRSNFANELFVAIPDKGMRFNLNGAEIILIPAHFLHSPGNFQLYDATSKTLFSGDLGTSIPPSGGIYREKFSEVADFNEHVKYMGGFHKRYVTSGKVCKLWARMISELDIEMIVPQHGHRYFKGKDMVNRFIDWISNLQCGIDLLDKKDFVIPKD